MIMDRELGTECLEIISQSLLYLQVFPVVSNRDEEWK